MPYKKTISKRERIRRGAYVFFFSLIIGVIGFIIYLIVEPGGGPRGPVGAPAEAATPAERQALMEESRELEAQFRQMTAGDEPPGDEAVGILRRAFEAQRRALTNNPTAPQEERTRLDRLERDLIEFEGGFLARRVDSLRADARERRAESDFENAILLLQEALEVQERINREMRTSPHASTATASTISRDIVNWRAEPLIRLSRESEELARAAIREERWADALEYFTDARDAQARINDEFSRTPYVNRTRITSLESEIADLRTLEVRAGIDSHRREGEQLLAEGAFDQAAAQFAEAAGRQRELNREFPGSRFASSAALRELETARETALSGDLAAELTAAVEAMDASLRAWEAGEAMNHLNSILFASERLRADYPLSEFNDEALALRIAYLDGMRDRLAGLLDEISRNLRPVPGHADTAMYSRETSQDLFRAVMNRNPSRQLGDSRPVDSVNWDDAVEFCRRLSWVIARDVRLPSIEEFLAAAEENEAANDLAWDLTNSGGESHTVASRDSNEHGFHDLWGNVAEWLYPAANRRAPVAGGSYDDTLSNLNEPPIQQVDTNQRSRAIGFRFVVHF